jgi:hypothetical protein
MEGAHPQGRLDSAQGVHGDVHKHNIIFYLIFALAQKFLPGGKETEISC